MPNPEVYTQRTIVMQRILDAVQHGYTHWCHGSIPIDRCARLANKFDLNYQIFSDRNVRCRRKRNGLGNANLIMWLHGEQINWWLFVTSPESGSHPAHAIEKLNDAMNREGRVELDGFELVVLPKKGAPGTRMTWRMAERKYQDWRISIIDTVRSRRAHAMHHLLYQLWSSPGFSAVRSQVGKLAALYRAEVKRASIKDAPAPPKRLGYVRRLKHDGIRLAQLKYQANQNGQPHS